MSRVKLVVAAAATAVALAGCAAMPDWMTPEWASSSSSPPMQPLRFESDPPGADVHTAQGQTCFTPCEIAVPSEPQSVTIAKEGFLPQTVQINIGEPPEHHFWENPPPSLIPNPVRVVLQVAPPPRRPPIRRRRRPVSRAHTRRHTAASSAARSPFPDPPPVQQPASSPFPPPPPTATTQTR